MAEKERIRRKEAGFVGVNLIRKGDRTLFDRLEKEIKSNPELDRGKIIRIALQERYDRIDEATKNVQV